MVRTALLALLLGLLLALPSLALAGEVAERMRAVAPIRGIGVSIGDPGCPFMITAVRSTGAG